MLTLTDNQIADLETIIDSRGLPMLLAAIENICRLKAEHIQTNWQDTALAALWNDRANKIGAITDLMVKPNDTITVDLPGL